MNLGLVVIAVILCGLVAGSASAYLDGVPAIDITNIMLWVFYALLLAIIILIVCNIPEKETPRKKTTGHSGNGGRGDDDAPKPAPAPRGGISRRTEDAIDVTKEFETLFNKYKIR